MKQSIAVLLLISLPFACKKDNSLNTIFHSAYGTWEYERYSGYPFMDTYLPPGNGRIIVLSENGRFERKQHDTVLFKGTYSIKNKRDCYDRENELFFSTNDNAYFLDGYISIDKDTLTLSSSSCLMDGGSTSYIRIK